MASTLNLTYRAALSQLDFSSPVHSLLCLYFLRPVTMATGNSSTGLSADQLQEVLKAVKEGMRDEVASLKRELASDREASDERLLKKLKLEKAPSFKKNTHEKQYLFNEEVSSKMEAATSGDSPCRGKGKDPTGNWRKV